MGSGGSRISGGEEGGLTKGRSLFQQKNFEKMGVVSIVSCRVSGGPPKKQPLMGVESTIYQQFKI